LSELAKAAAWHGVAELFACMKVRFGSVIWPLINVKVERRSVDIYDNTTKDLKG
jgi:hypothetical protein